MLILFEKQNWFSKMYSLNEWQVILDYLKSVADLLNKNAKPFYLI